MSKSSAYIVVSCDKYGFEEEIELTPLALHDAWDERNVGKELDKMGWTSGEVEGVHEDYCIDCSPEDPDEEDT